MASKDIKYTNECRKLLEVGVDKLADTVKVTLGPRELLGAGEEFLPRVVGVEQLLGHCDCFPRKLTTEAQRHREGRRAIMK